jgi:hypothetical protein
MGANELISGGEPREQRLREFERQPARMKRWTIVSIDLPSYGISPSNWYSFTGSELAEVWFLMTDLSGNAHQLCALYGRRMTIEQLFRDGKNICNGWSLRDTKLKILTRSESLFTPLPPEVAISFGTWKRK